MRVYTLTELFCLTRAELFTLHTRIAGELPMLNETEREIALNNLRKLQRVLACPRNAPP
jgi:hypothetical protein